MINSLIFLITTGPLLALMAVVYSVMCTEPGEIFSGLYKWLENKLMARTKWINENNGGDDPGSKIYVRKYIGKYFSYRKQVRDYEWIFKPIIGCERCVGGQMALWFYIALCFYGMDYYDPFEHIALICITIYFTVIFKTFYLWLKALQQKY